ncbi:MAG: hypothetical protein ACFCGT_20050 [Sandaracinaceae bacterium]
MRAAVGVVLPALLVGCGAGAVAPRDPSDEEEEPPRYGLALRFTDGGETEEGPRTRVQLVAIEPDGATTTDDVGVERGACFHQPPPAGALLAGRCWWVEGAVVFLVLRDGDAVVAARAPEESAGDPDAFREVGRVEVPADARLEIVSPYGAVVEGGEGGG